MSIRDIYNSDNSIKPDMLRRISVPQKGIEAQKLFTEFLGFFIAYDLRGFSDVTWSCGPVKGSRAFIWVSPGGGFTTAGKNLRKGVVS